MSSWRQLLRLAFLGTSIGLLVLALAGVAFGISVPGGNLRAACRWAWLMPLFLSPCALAGGALAGWICAVLNRAHQKQIVLLGVLTVILLVIGAAQASDFHRKFVAGPWCCNLRVK